ncbi:ribonuclease P protein component [Leptolyngbya cf. ectocarpi LEGE 11479]|uniref:Ribonuclease P protein component n=1 Tax=Leptolyngbya cf. ectocarpi LEGE 11479 TaxID=1828722 RepID=A0A929FBG2_LEPEC|nr:ribonuclease P protein component [Leptolyngbya ectocarpi]MBE9070716.1 ribonuclease P protein component [Leptolyngbya cf. ectocarpi LEGE 11479]
MALPRQHRLRSPRSFSQVYRQGRRAGSYCLAVKALKKQIPDERLSNQPSSGICFGVSISRKVHKRAVVRNRIKRQIHAALTTLLPRAHGAWWVVINVRTPAISCEYYEFLRELEKLLVELEVLHGH